MKLILLSLVALVCGGPRDRFATANAKSDPKPDDTKPAESESAALKAQLDQQAAQIAELQKQLTAKAEAQPEDTSTLALLCKGAGVSLEDARWRVRAGLDPEQAVQAALAQKEFDAAKAAEAAAKAKATETTQPKS